VELIIVARAAYFVGTVRVEGVNAPLDPSVLVTASRLHLGQRFAEGDLNSARELLGSVLKDNGYYQATVDYRVVTDPHTQAAEIIFSVVPGKPARLSSVEFHGDLAVPIHRLTGRSGWKVHAHLTSAQLERGLYKIHQLYLKLGKPQATVVVLNRVYDPQKNTERLAVQIDVGPQVNVRVEGAKVSSSTLKEFLPFYREGNLDQTAVVQGGEVLRQHFEEKGYFAAQVKGEKVSSPDAQVVEITYRVALGEPGQFVGYSLRGNESILSEELAKVMSIHPKDFLRKQGTFTHDLLAQDVAALKALYERRGYQAVEIEPQIHENYRDQRGHLFVTFEIQEGPQTTVNQLLLEGVDQATVKEVWPSLLSRPGQPYAEANVQADRESLLQYFADRGRPNASVTWETSPASAAEKVDLKFRIAPGVQERIERVAILGLKHTREGTARRELSFRHGAPLRQSDILESQRRLYDLGVFSQVQIATEDTQSPQPGRTVLVSLEEARRWTVGYGGGIEIQRLGSDEPQGVFKVSPRLSLEVSRLNVGGRAQTLSLRGRLSTIETGGAISYLIPRFPTRRDLSLRLSALVDRSREVITFTSRRREALLSLEKRYSPATFVAGRFSFRKVEALDFPPGAEQQIPISSRDARIAMLGLGYANDQRDEATDATRGSYSLADIGLSWKRLGSQSNFLRVSGQNATYYRINPHLIFARNTRIALESTVGKVTPTGEIPLPERFFMGGSESHRGFSINQAGPRDLISGFPLGGEALFFNTFELRVRLANERLGLVLFQDTGNVYSEVNRMHLLKFQQNSPTDLDFTSLAAGIGVRYKTPVGPVRFDVGYNFNAPQYQVTVPDGTPGGVREVRRLPRFQFFLGIGQSF
jgi:outer membrane protein assembly complex protein YaeT